MMEDPSSPPPEKPAEPEPAAQPSPELLKLLERQNRKWRAAEAEIAKQREQER
jgi:hypothetical protein